MKKKAFTLIELIIATALLSIMVAVITTVFLAGLKVWISGRNRTEIREEAGIAMESMVRDLSQAGPITAATAAAITFTADIDNDSVNETVTFSLDAGNIIRTVDGAAATLMPDAQTLAFSYIDSNNTGIVPPFTPAQLSSIRVVTIFLRMSKAAETYPPISLNPLSSSAYTRNQIL